MNEKPTRHILSLSGGKDSTALAVYMRDKVPEMEYVFCDTGEELPETYEYLDKVEAYLGREIRRLKNNREGFADLLAARKGFLPSPAARWCTQYLKIVPFEQYVGDDPAISYIAIRADEAHRKGYLSTKPNIRARYPFIEDGITKSDVTRLLYDSGLGMPSYYEWRSRSGCYFCFFQQRNEWVGLLERHPDLFWKAAAYEKFDSTTGQRYTWVPRESLEDLAKPERVRQIQADLDKREATRQGAKVRKTLLDLFTEDVSDSEEGCLICHL
jgi:3'-phosphoadenosine 5'-phosphosulfate sulfotransferase (PAPS reductase)/FAD synthetase